MTENTTEVQNDYLTCDLVYVSKNVNKEDNTFFVHVFRGGHLNIDGNQAQVRILSNSRLVSTLGHELTAPMTVDIPAGFGVLELDEDYPYTRRDGTLLPSYALHARHDAAKASEYYKAHGKFYDGRIIQTSPCGNNEVYDNSETSDASEAVVDSAPAIG